MKLGGWVIKNIFNWDLSLTLSIKRVKKENQYIKKIKKRDRKILESHLLEPTYIN